MTDIEAYRDAVMSAEARAEDAEEARAEWARLFVSALDRADDAERKVAAVEALAKAWVGFDDSHFYGDAVLRALQGDTP